MSDEGKPEATTRPTDPSGNRDANARSSVELSAPWGGQQRMQQQQQLTSGTHRPSESADFVRERSRVHETFIRENARNKRIGMILAFTLIILAALVVVFAPEGRQTLSYWVGAALIIFAAGAAGFGRVWAKTGSISFGADQDKRGLKE